MGHSPGDGPGYVPRLPPPRPQSVGGAKADYLDASFFSEVLDPSYGQRQAIRTSYGCIIVDDRGVMHVHVDGELRHELDRQAARNHMEDTRAQIGAREVRMYRNGTHIVTERDGRQVPSLDRRELARIQAQKIMEQSVAEKRRAIQAEDLSPSGRRPLRNAEGQRITVPEPVRCEVCGGDDRRITYVNGVEHEDRWYGLGDDCPRCFIPSHDVVIPWPSLRKPLDVVRLVGIVGLAATIAVAR